MSSANLSSDVVGSVSGECKNTNGVLQLDAAYDVAKLNDG